MRSFWITQVGHKSNDKRPNKKNKRIRHTEGPCEDRGRDCSDVATAQDARGHQKRDEAGRLFP